MASEGLHEDRKQLRTETVDHHRAIVSLMEELEAVDWYDQRVDAASDEELKEILAHNRDEEKEHASMLLEWLRRHDPALDEHLRTYLRSEGSITAAESAAGEPADGAAPDAAPGDGSLGIGSLRREGAR